ncbi:hypothetical protein ACPOL_2151 [Acidisarcina polymorpha]|uniref:Uncharacterized protein n=1 Tax=Acidisarcina polymorpha TaxID=2211140 RepID=A0A2Z5FYJ0_9BACT|nr:hypothetical protein [Acidisarcina polymorpha]AXC11475.1 hypothetical protein ACPOL_2151 [Acidisarcina polymorpha]
MSTTANPASSTGRLFGIPIGDFGWFASLLLSFSLGFASFFGATFLGIFGLLIYNQGGHHTVNYADSYRLIGLPVGIGVLLLSLILFGFLWVRRKVAGR